jgi:sensor histidine kinase YesM
LIRETSLKSRRFTGSFDAQFQYRNGDYNRYMKYFKFFVTPEHQPRSTFYIVLESARHNIVLPAIPVPNSFSDFLQKATYYSNNYQYSLYKPKLPEAKYHAWIMSRDETGKWESVSTGKQVLFY